MHRSGWRAGRVAGRTGMVVALIACGALVGCTRTSDLSAQVEVTTTTVRVPVRQVPRATTSTTPPSTTAPAARPGAPTTAAPAAPGADKGKGTTATTEPPLAALLAALRAAGAIRDTTATTQPAPPPTTTTTLIPANPAGLVVTAQNALVHPGESQTIKVSSSGDGAAPPLLACAGRDYRPSGTGFVSAGFASTPSCSAGPTPTLVRTLPADVAAGQYVFCTEVTSGAGPTSVCTAYVVVPYPT